MIASGQSTSGPSAVRTPPLVVAPPATLHAAGVFGDWSPVDRGTPAKREIEDRLDFLDRDMTEKG